MGQLGIFVIVLNSASVYFCVFLLTDCKIGACRSEEHNKKGTGQEKTRVLFS